MYAEQLRERYRDIGLRLRPMPAPTPRPVVVKDELPPLRFVVSRTPEHHIPKGGYALAGPLSIRKIICVVARLYGVPVLDIMSSRRTASIVVPRHVVMFLAREHTRLSLPQIGRALGDRDHTTCLSGWRKIQRMIDGGDERLTADISAIRMQLGIQE